MTTTEDSAEHHDGLSEVEEAMLEFAGRFYRQPGRQADAIRDEFGVSVTRFWQLVNQLVDTQAALAHDPVLVHRLQQIRAQRDTGRAARARLPF